MKRFFKIVCFLFVGFTSAQDKKTESVYFEFERYDLDSKQQQQIIDFLVKIDTTTIEAVQIYGYCDDRGDNDYNYKLSEDRVHTVQQLLSSNGFDKSKIVVIEGKGRVLLVKDDYSKVAEARTKNRRVDLLLVKKNSFGKGIYNSIKENHKVGDRIYLETILFSMGSSQLSLRAKKELDRIASILNKNKQIEFEIRGHVCCTPKDFTDAVDKATNERKLSVNRAKVVFKYLIAKKINSLRMTYIGCGNKFTLNKGSELDRRVEFLITKI